MNWSHSKTELANNRGVVFQIGENNRAVSLGRGLQLLADESEFREYISVLLRNCGYEAIRWEMPPLSYDSVDEQFEFAVINSPGLDVRPDKETFSSYFADMGSGKVAAFPNLGGDALLIVPSPIDAESNYSHLIRFLKSAPGNQVQELWKQVGIRALEKCGRNPVWINTAGAGVAWLHLRLDSRPKYYVHAPYRHAP